MKNIFAATILTAALLASCGQQAPQLERGQEMQAGDVYWVCDTTGENCECRAIGAATCPEEAADARH